MACENKLIAYWVIFHAFFLSADFFQLILFQNQVFGKIISGTLSVSNSLDPDQVRHYVGPDLGPNCSQRVSADDTSRKIVIQ